jgi:hypothetical protein
VQFAFYLHQLNIKIISDQIKRDNVDYIRY